MSDDDQELDMDSDGEDGWDDGMQDMAGGTAVKRAHHNALERKRRVHIKDSFHGLRDSIPAIQGDKASRAVILNKATEYIETMRSRNSGHQKDIDTLKSQNQLLESQVRALEKAIAMDGFPETQMTEDGLINLKTEACEPPGVNVSDSDHGSHNSPDHQVAIRTSRRKKKLKPLPGE